MIKSSGRQDCGYSRRNNLAENLRDLGKGLLVAGLFTYFFYRSIWALPFMAPVGWFYLRRSRRHWRRRSDRQLLIQFRECIQAVAAAMRAGYAVENAFLDCITDIRSMFGENCAMERELRKLRQGLANNVTLELLLAEMGQRSGLEEIREFAEVFGIAKRNGGSIPAIIDAASDSISRRLAAAEETETLLSARKLEQRVMNAMPFMIVWYVEASNPGYFDMLYGNLSGVAVMTVCMGIYLVAYALSERIFDRTFGER